jgi:hypothetical protein
MDLDEIPDICILIWSRVSGLKQFRDGSDSDGASGFVQISGNN